VEHSDGRDGRFLVPFHLPLHMTDIVLQYPSCPLESVIDGEGRIAVALILTRRPIDVDLPVAWQLQVDGYFKWAARAVVPSWPSHDDAAGRDAAEASFQHRNAVLDPCTVAFAVLAPFEVDFDRCLHLSDPLAVPVRPLCIESAIGN
jgi:hypothetical protein